MDASDFLSIDQLKDFHKLKSSKGSIEQKVKLIQEVYTLEKFIHAPESLYELWIDLFKEDELPIAWLPGNKEKEDSNISSLMKDLNLRSYKELHQWSFDNKAEFWKRTIEKLGIKFDKRYSQVLDLQRGVEDPSWLEGAKLNIIDSCFLADPLRAAIIQGSEDGETKKISFAELDKLVNKIASGLIHAGFQTGDSIIVYMPLTIESIAAYLAIVKAGMAVVSVADSFSSAELKKRIEITNAKGIFTCDGYMYGGKLLDVFLRVKESDAPTAIISSYVGKGAKRDDKKDILFEDLLKGENFSSFIADPDSTTNILFSSGTTKAPKAIPWTHITPLKCAADGYYHQNIKEGDVVSWTTGMGWMMAPWLIYASLINKATIAIFTGAATLEKFGKFVDEAKVTVLGTIPSVVKVWKAQKFHEKFKWNTVKVFSSTGEPSNQEDYFYLMSIAGFKVPVIEYCGGTEIGGGYITGTVVQPASPAVFTTPALGTNFYLINEKREVAPIGLQGEVFIVPPSIGLTQKLLNKNHYEEYYEGTPKGPKGETLRKHGDAFDTVLMDNELFYKSIGRTDDAMNLGGIKVSAVEIEEVLNKHPQIIETAAISVPEGKGGPERLIVVFVSRESISDKAALKKELQVMLTKELNPLFRITEIEERTSLPRTASNKLMRRELRKEFLDK